MTVLHYTGADNDRGGIISVVRGLAGAGRFECLLGVSRGAVQHRAPPLPVVEFSPVASEQLDLRTFWRARGVAREARVWLAAEAARVFHAHSRAGLAVALWLHAMGERGFVGSVHCYGRRGWFYRWAARRLGDRLFWLSPAMKAYYGVGDAGSWTRCMPGCVPPRPLQGRARSRGAGATLHLGGIGMLVAWKRWHLLLDALALLPPATRAHVRFTHIGAPADDAASRRYAGKLRAMTAAHGLTDRVTWRGEQPDVARFLEEIDCLVVASCREPLSVAMLEALRAGVPVLASRSGGSCDVVSPLRTGWLFAPDDPRDLARAITMLTETGALQRIDIRPDDLARFDATAVAMEWARIYAGL